MASVLALRAALKATIKANLPVNDRATVYDTVPGISELPGIVIEPGKADFEVTMGRGLDEWHFNIFIVCSRADEMNGQNVLDSYISGSGTQSIRQIIFQNPAIGLTDGTTAYVKSMKGYGGTTKEGGVGVVGAILTVCVFTDGRT